MFEVEAALAEKLQQLLGSGFDPGSATTGVQYAGDGGYRRHEYATLFAHPRCGAHETNGLIGAYHLDSLGGPEGSWGFPLSDEYADGEGRSSDFEGGVLFWTPEYGVLEIYADTPPVAPDVDWPKVDTRERFRYVMRLLVEDYGYPVAGAAGLVGNLYPESGIIPSRLEGSASGSPLRARDFAGNMRDFSPEEVRDRDRGAGRGPAKPGVGLAQWTSGARRSGLFTHAHNGTVLGFDVLFNMDAQVDYLVHELRTSYPGVNGTLTDPGVSVNDACDDVVYRFEVPGAILDGGTKLPRADQRVQAVFIARRAHADRAVREYQG